MSISCGSLLSVNNCGFPGVWEQGWDRIKEAVNSGSVLQLLGEVQGLSKVSSLCPMPWIIFTLGNARLGKGDAKKLVCGLSHLPTCKQQALEMLAASFCLILRILFLMVIFAN